MDGKKLKIMLDIDRNIPYHISVELMIIKPLEL